MKWRTEVEVPPGDDLIDYSSRVLLLGSCFATHLSEKLQYYQFRQTCNPFGVVFHPIPMERLLERALGEFWFQPEEVFEGAGRWRCLQAHSSVSGASREEALGALNAALAGLRQAALEATHLVLTLGTAYGFRYLKSGQLVANCHKLPAREFERKLTPPDVLEESLSRMLQTLRRENPEVTCLLTVSPVRHIRDGLVENQRSKAHLITAAHRLVDGGLASYFPSYEIFMDELRDYRFYSRDLVHPSEVAVDYVWERFGASWVAPGARPVMDQVAALRKGLSHRPLHPGSTGEAGFRKSLEEQMARLLVQFPHMDFGTDRAG